MGLRGGTNVLLNSVHYVIYCRYFLDYWSVQIRSFECSVRTLEKTWGLETIPSPGWQTVYGNSPRTGDMPYWSVSISQTPAFLLAALRVTPRAFLPQHKDQEAEGGVNMYHSTPHGPGPSWS